MCLIHFSVYRSSLKLHALRIHRPPSASACDANNPCETHVHQQRRLFLVCEEPDELDCAFIAPTDYTDFLWTSMKASAKSRDTSSVCEAGAGSRAVRRFLPDRSSQTLDAANGSPEW